MLKIRLRRELPLQLFTERDERNVLAHKEILGW